MTPRNSPPPRRQSPPPRTPVLPPGAHVPARRNAAATRPDQLQPFVRALIWPVFVLSIANGVFLYGLPWLAEGWYAWPIRPSINAGAMGAGYLIGVLGAGMGLFAVNHWRSIRSFMPAIFTIGILLTIATLLHADRFRWGSPLTWIWIVVYVAIPIVAALVWSLQEVSGKSAPAAADGLAVTAGASVAIGSIISLTGLIWFLTPQSIMAIWPWPLTPLLTRSLASWYVFMGVLLLVSGTTSRHVREIPLVHATVAGWSMLLLLLVPFHWADLLAGAALLFWIACHVLLLIFCGASALKAWERMRRAGDEF